ncbi:MAG: sulfotransferase domain-containing protein [Desulfarculaceae bacterium]|jgi:hypothetical protein
MPRPDPHLSGNKVSHAWQHWLRLQFMFLLRRNSNRYKAVKKYKRKLFGFEKVYILLEHPKCGRTWLRYMLCQAEALAHGVPLRNTVHSVWYARHSLPRVSYDHGFKDLVPLSEYSLDFTKMHPGVQGCIFMVRKPERVMVSWYYQCRFRENLFEGSLPDFIRHPLLGIQFYVQYVEHYFQHIQQINHTVITYEDLKRDPAATLAKVLEFVHLKISPESVEKIVANSTFEQMKRLEQSSSLGVEWLQSDSKDPRTWKVRSGGQEKLADILSPPDLEYIRSCYEQSPVFRELGYVS